MPDIIDLTDDVEEALPARPPPLLVQNSMRSGAIAQLNPMSQAYPRPSMPYPPLYASTATQLLQQQYRPMPYALPQSNFTSNTPSFPPCAPTPYTPQPRISFSLVSTTEFTATSDRIITRDVAFHHFCLFILTFHRL